MTLVFDLIVLSLLSSHGANVMIQDTKGRSVFHWAVKSPSLQCLKTLYRHATPIIINKAVCTLCTAELLLANSTHWPMGAIFKWFLSSKALCLL